MTQKNELTKPNQPLSFTKPVLIGAGIALTLIALFLAGVDNADPAWGKYWMVKPLIIVPLAGAMGGAFFYFMNQLSHHRGLNKTVAILLGLIIYVVGLWLGSILGLDGTLWD